MLAVKTSQRLSDYTRQITASSVMIVSRNNDGQGDVGAGFFVAPRVVVTCSHVLGLTTPNAGGDLKEIVITMADGNRFYGQVVDFDPQIDVAIVYVHAPEQIETYFLNLGNSGTVRDAEAIMTIGSPLGYMNTVSYGIVSNRNPGDKNHFLLDIRTNPGNSGGLVYSLDKQAVIGIASAIVNEQGQAQAGIAVGICIDPIKDMLKRNQIQFTYRENEQE